MPSTGIFTQRVVLASLYRVLTVGTACATLATYVADNVTGVGTVGTVLVVLLSVAIGCLLYIAVVSLQGEHIILRSCPSCGNKVKSFKAFLRGTVSAKALTLLRMEVVVFATYFALAYVDTAIDATRRDCPSVEVDRVTLVGMMVGGCTVAAAIALGTSAALAKRSGPSCCKDCTLNPDNAFVTTRKMP